MPERPENVHGGRGSPKDFMVGRSETAVSERKNVRKSSVELTELFKVFPDIRTGKAFLEGVMDRLEASARFGAMAVRIDKFKHKKGVDVKQYALDLFLDVAGVIDAVCREESGVWGFIDRKVFGCFFMDRTPEECVALGEVFRCRLSMLREETVSVGVAAFPTLDYPRKRILDNARKALDHAAFLGPGVVTAFSAVSLNISGDKMYQKGNIQGAVEEYTKARRLDPENVNVLNSLGVCYGVTGEFEDALSLFEEALKIDSDEVMAGYNAAVVCIKNGDSDRALEYLRRVDGRGKNVFEVKHRIGRILMEQGRAKEAVVPLESAVALNPESGPAFRVLGDCYAELGDNMAAVRAYKKAIKCNPYDAASISALGRIFDLQGENIEIATLFCKHSVSISPDNGLYRYRLAKLYLKQNCLNDALREFVKATKLGYDALEYIEQIQNHLTAEAS